MIANVLHSCCVDMLIIIFKSSLVFVDETIEIEAEFVVWKLKELIITNYE